MTLIVNIIKENMVKLPYDVIVNHIIPYTYEIQPIYLRLDIVSFRRDIELVKNIYGFHYNYLILLNDLILFHNDSNKTKEFNPKRSLESKIIFIWSRMTPQKRKHFICVNLSATPNFYHSLR
jgi:hypothetical protein